MEFEEGRVVSTPQGNKIILSMSDLTDILDVNGLHEITEFISDNLNTKRLECEAELQKANDELDSYESQNEEYHDCILEAANAIEELVDSINDSKRLNKSELVKRLTEIHENLWMEV